VWRFVAGLTKFEDYEGLMGEDIFFNHDLNYCQVVFYSMFLRGKEHKLRTVIWQVSHNMVMILHFLCMH
jgi:hypothetical protein